MRIGTGWDIHRLVEGRKMVLGGVAIPFPKGPLGHSDGDVLLHALVDALLGAAAMGDIGDYFPDSDPKWKGADSAMLLARVLPTVREKGFRLHNIDTTIIVQELKVSPHRANIRARLAGLLGLPLESVSVKAKTHEGLDEIGRGNAIACQAVVLLKEISDR
jgi:2-C-methyl-D-erythritol 2,4-cyclodiphosphate synthase